MTERLAFTCHGSEKAIAAPGDRARTEAAPSTSTAAAGASPAVTARRLERRNWAFILLLAFTAALYFRPQDTFRILNPLHLAELSAIFGLLALVAGRLTRGQTVTRVTPELVGVAALGVIMLATAPFSIWPGGAVATFNDLYLKVILIYLLMANTIVTPKRLERFVWLLIIASGYIAFRTVLDYARGINLIEHGRVEGAVGGIFRNPNDLALNMVAILPLALFAAMRPSGTLRRVVAGGCGALMLAAIVASHSRSGTLGLVAMAGVLVVYAIRRRPGFVLGGAVALALALPLVPSSYWERVASITDASKDDTGSREARRTLLRESWRAFKENPVVGVGAGQFQAWDPEGREQPWRESHDVLLQVAAELGTGGLLVMIFLIGRGALAVHETRALLRRAHPTVRGRRSSRGRRLAGPAASTNAGPPVVTDAEATMLDAHAAAMAAALAGWFICALFASVAYNWTFYYVLALAAAPREMLLDRLSLVTAAARVPATRAGRWLVAVRT